MVNHHSAVNYLRFWHSLVLQKEITGTHEEKRQQSVSKRLLVSNYICYNTFTESYRKTKSHGLREGEGRAYHVCLKCKLFQVKETTGGSLLDAQSTQHQCLRKESSVVTINWKNNRRSWMRQKQYCQFSQQRSSLQAFTNDTIWLNTLQYI